MTNCTVIGHGYWGRNIARDVHANENLHLEAIVEPDASAHGSAARLYPLTRIYSDLSNLNPVTVQDSIVFVCVPPQYHAAVLEQLAEAGATNVCVAKPYCLNLEDAKKYSDIVKVVDYTFLFSNAVQALPKFLDELGMIHHVSCVRANLGKVQDCGVLHDLTVHDLSILQAVGFHLTPAPAFSAYSQYIADTMYSGTRFIYSNSTTIHVHNSWLSHLKRKTMIFTAEKGTLVYDDNEPVDKITIYDKFIENPEDPALMQYKYGDTRIPYIAANNPLGAMVEACRIAYKSGEQHKSVQFALEIHEMLEAVSNENNLRGQ